MLKLLFCQHYYHNPDRSQSTESDTFMLAKEIKS